MRLGKILQMNDSQYLFKNNLIKVNATEEEMRTVGIKFVYPGDVTENDIRREQKLGYRLNYGEQ